MPPSANSSDWTGEDHGQAEQPGVRADEDGSEGTPHEVPAGPSRHREVEHLGREHEGRDESGQRCDAVVDLTACAPQCDRDARGCDACGGERGGRVEESVRNVHRRASRSLLHTMCNNVCSAPTVRADGGAGRLSVTRVSSGATLRPAFLGREQPVEFAASTLSEGSPIIEHMIEVQEQVREAGEVEDLSASDLLALARDRKAAEDQAAAELLEVAARWADLHPPESIHTARRVHRPRAVSTRNRIAGEGCPLVAEFCVAELGAVLGVSTTSAKKLIGHALELRHRLPRLWAQVHAGPCRTVACPPGRRDDHPHVARPYRRGRTVGRRARSLPSPGRSVTAQLERLVAETIKRHDLAAADPLSDPGGRLPAGRPASRSASTPTTCTSPAPCASRPSLDLPTRSTSTVRSPMVLLRRRRSGRPSRSTYAAPRPSAISLAPRPRSICSARAHGDARADDGLPAARRGRPPHPLRRDHEPDQ